MKDKNNFLFRWFAKITGWIPGMLFYRPRYYHENKCNKSRPLKGPAIIISNHTSLHDWFVLFLTFPFRAVRCLVSEALYAHPFVGWMSRQVGNILVHRERSDLSFMAKAEKALNKGGTIAIFPEGHLMHDGKIDNFRPSAVYLALRTGTPIVPMYIEGNYCTSKRTRVIIGEKIYLRDYCQEDNPSIEKVRALCDMLRDKVLALRRLMNLYRKTGVYGANPMNWFADFANTTLYPTAPFVFPTKFHYYGNATKKDRKIKGAGLIASKHFSFCDPPILSVHYYPRRVHTIVAEELFNSKPWLFKHLGCIEYKRVTASYDPRCMIQTLNILHAKGIVGIYPEGHLIKDGVGEFADGVAYFAIQSRAPIYMYCMLKPYKPFHRNHVMIGETIYVDKLFTQEELADKATIHRLTILLHDRMSELFSEGQKYLKKVKN